MKYCIAGKNEIAIFGVELLLKSGISRDKIVACCNSNDTGINGWQPSFRNYCVRNNILVLHLEEIYNLVALVFISLEFDKIIKISKFRSRALFNIHFSLLPEYKGMYTSAMPILEGREYSGVTLHKIDEGIDTGDIIDQVRFKLDYKITSFELYGKYIEYAKELLKNNIFKIINDSYTAVPQCVYNSTYYSKKTIDYKNLNIDLNTTAFHIHNQIRAFSFRPFQLAKINNIEISHSLIANIRSIGKPGVLTMICEDSFYLRSIDYDLIVYRDVLDQIFIETRKDNLDFIMAKIDKGYNINEKGVNGWNCIILATYHGSIRIFDYLINGIVDINEKNYNGTTLLMYAMTHAKNSRNLYFLERLLDCGADTRSIDFFGNDIFYYINKSNKEIMQLISKYV